MFSFHAAQAQTVPQPATPPAIDQVPPAPAAPAVPGLDGWPVTVESPGQVTVQEIYEGAVAQRSELRRQLSRLQDQRREVASQLRSESVVSADRNGLEARLKTIDANIASVDAQLVHADMTVARAAAVPGAVVTPPPPAPRRDSWMNSGFAVVFALFVMAPVAVAVARRIWKRSTLPPSLRPEMVASMDRRLDQIQQAVDSVAIETERIGESQRFLTRVLSERERVPLKQG